MHFLTPLTAGHRGPEPGKNEAGGCRKCGHGARGEGKILRRASLAQDDMEEGLCGIAGGGAGSADMVRGGKARSFDALRLLRMTWGRDSAESREAAQEVRTWCAGEGKILRRASLAQDDMGEGLCGIAGGGAGAMRGEGSGTAADRLRGQLSGACCGRRRCCSGPAPSRASRPSPLPGR